MYQAYEDIERLPRPERCQLFDSGDGPERVWAAWSLALELGGRSRSLLVEDLTPSASARG